MVGRRVVEGVELDQQASEHLAAIEAQEARRAALTRRAADEPIVLDADVLVVGGGAGGLWAAISARRHGPPDCRVVLVDARMVGRTGHTTFSNAWMVVVTPDDDLEACTRDIVAGNEWMADQELVHEVLAGSYDRLKDMERYGLEFPRDEKGAYERRPTRGLRVTQVHHPVGGGLELCWKLRQAAANLGVDIVDRVFVTSLVRGADGGLAGAVGVDARTGEFYHLRAPATIVATNSVTFRSGFVRDITGTGTLMAYEAGATLANGEFSYLRPGTPKFYFEGITFAIQDGARFVNARGEQFMERYQPDWGDRADVQYIAAAFCREKQAGNAPVYLDMSLVPRERRDFYFHSTVRWMDMFLSKLDRRARIDMFGRTPYYPLNQMTKLGIRTDVSCRSTVPGLLAAGLAQAGCATHFAGFHIGMCTGTGWIAGRSAVEDARRREVPRLEPGLLARLRAEALRDLSADASPRSDALVRELQKVIFRFDVSVLKEAGRLQQALDRLEQLRARAEALAAPDTHELVRVKELRAMLLAAEMALRAGQVRTESRLSHLREDHPERDDAHWIRRVLIRQLDERMTLSTEPIPTPLVPPPAASRTGGVPAEMRATPR